MRELDDDLWCHASSVATTTTLVASHLAIDEIDRTILIDAAWLHDIGKLTIPRTILDKPGKLDPDEWSMMQQHSARGSDFVHTKRSTNTLAHLIRHHHERFDGRGYPDRLAGETIPLGSRILAVVDAYDAMKSTRPYKPAMCTDDAMAELRRCAGSQFDPAITNLFISLAPDITKVPIP